MSQVLLKGNCGSQGLTSRQMLWTTGSSRQGSLVRNHSIQFWVHWRLKRLGVGPNCGITLTAPARFSETTFSPGRCQASHHREEKDHGNVSDTSRKYIEFCD